MNTLTQQFIAEVRDYVDEAATGFLALEQSAHDQSLINGIFRNFHTIKGTSGIFPEFAPITSLTHVAEDLMDQIRNGEREISTDLVDLFLATLDLLSTWIDALEANGLLPASAESAGEDLRGRILVILGEGGAAQPPEETGAEQAGDEGDDCRRRLLAAWLLGLEAAEKARLDELARISPAAVAFCYTPDPSCFFFGEDPVNLFRQLDQIHQLRAVLPDAPVDVGALDPFACCISFIAVSCDQTEDIDSVFGYVRQQITLLPLEQALLPPPAASASASASASAVPAPAPAPAPAGASIVLGLSAEAPAAEAPEFVANAAAGGTRAGAATFIRVDQLLIHRFTDLVGEMIIAKNSLPYLCQRADSEYLAPELAGEIDACYTTINHIVGGLQDIAMGMRMLPASKAFERFPRLVRDISHKLGKKIALSLEGEDTCADKDVIEALAEPLVHMVRNSLDHGIELPEERLAAGKSAEGRITLRAAQETACIVVQIIDDGKGIDPAMIRRKAAEKGIMSAEALSVMPDDEVIQLVMAPNFSTAETISDLSGRGVGMDAVHAMVTFFGGSIRVASKLGQGTTVRISLPLSMAVTKALIVRQGACTFGIPAAEVVESIINIPLSRVVTVRTAPGLKVRGELLPLYSMERLLDMEGAHPWFPEGFSAVVVRMRNEVVALSVETSSDIVEVVVKPLHRALAHLSIYTGSTILGDGSIMFMLNLAEVIAHAD